MLGFARDDHTAEFHSSSVGQHCFVADQRRMYVERKGTQGRKEVPRGLARRRDRLSVEFDQWLAVEERSVMKRHKSEGQNGGKPQERNEFATH